MLGNKLKKAPNEDHTNQTRISLIYADDISHEVGREFLQMRSYVKDTQRLENMQKFCQENAIYFYSKDCNDDERQRPMPRVNSFPRNINKAHLKTNSGDDAWRSQLNNKKHQLQKSTDIFLMYHSPDTDHIRDQQKAPEPAIPEQQKPLVVKS